MHKLFIACIALAFCGALALAEEKKTEKDKPVEKPKAAAKAKPKAKVVPDKDKPLLDDEKVPKANPAPRVVAAYMRKAIAHGASIGVEEARELARWTPGKEIDEQMLLKYLKWRADYIAAQQAKFAKEQRERAAAEAPAAIVRELGEIRRELESARRDAQWRDAYQRADKSSETAPNLSRRRH